MKQASDHLLARAGLALEEDGRIRRRDLLDSVNDRAEPRAGTNDGDVVLLNGPSIILDGLSRRGRWATPRRHPIFR